MRPVSTYRRLLILGMTLPLVIVICRDRSLWLDEAMLGYSIVARSYAQLLQPLAYQQVAPIGYLLASKVCNSLFGHDDIAIRLPSIVAYLCLFVLLARRANRSPEGLLRFVLIAAAAGIVKYAFELKPYIYDVLSMAVLLDYGDLIFASAWRAPLFAMVSVMFSSVTFIQLPLFSLLFGLKQSKPPARLLFHFVLSLLPLGTYYFLFAYHHPANNFMHQYWHRHFLFSQGENGLAFVVRRLVGVVDAAYFTPVFQLLWIPYLLGLRKYIRERRYFALAATQLPIVLHLAFSAVRLYPFDGRRLTLYLIVPFAYVAADGLSAALTSLGAVTSLRRWSIVRRYGIGPVASAAIICAVVGNAFAYALLVKKREDIRPILADLQRQTQLYKRSVPLHFLPSSEAQFAYYAAQHHAAGKPFLEGYRTISQDEDWGPFLLDVLSYSKVVVVFSNSGRYFSGPKTPVGFLGSVNHTLAALRSVSGNTPRVSRFVWANNAGLFEVSSSRSATWE